jgi:hypothetical protein
MKTLDRRYRNRNIYILLHNQTAVSTWQLPNQLRRNYLALPSVSWKNGGM